MKKSLKLFVAIIMIAGFSTTLMAQNTASTLTATSAGAELVVPMVLTLTTPLHFGTLVYTGAGTCVLATLLNARNFNGLLLTSSATPTATNGVYHVTGTIGQTYAVTLPATITVTHTTIGTGVNTMTISALNYHCLSAGADNTAGTLIAGADDFRVGGTLTALAAQVPGIYAGTFNITVDYN
jgi:hypothetical protein